MKKRLLQILKAMVVAAVIMAGFFLVDNVILGVREAEAKVNAYEEAHNMHPEKITMKYDWYSGGGYISDNYRYNPVKDMILDEEYNTLWSPFFSKKMEEVKRFMDCNFVMEDYSVAFYFDGTDKMTRYDDLFIYGIYNTQPVAEEKRIEVAAELIMDVLTEMGDFYHFCGVHIDYYDLNGAYRISVPLSKEAVTKEMLMEGAKEISFENNLAIQEKWEAFCAQRVALWTLEAEGYEISLMGMKAYDGNYQLVMKKDGIEEVVGIYPKYLTDIEYEYGTFDNVLGYSGFYVYEMLTHMPYGNYYTVLDGEAICIAEAWGCQPKDCYSVDVDKNGVPEFICNVTFGTGGSDAVIYYKDGTRIFAGSCSDMLDVEYDNLHHTSSYATYLPEENVVEINYFLLSTDGYESKKYDIDLSKISFWEFVPDCGM